MLRLPNIHSRAHRLAAAPPSGGGGGAGHLFGGEAGIRRWDWGRRRLSPRLKHTTLGQTPLSPIPPLRGWLPSRLTYRQIYRFVAPAPAGAGAPPRGGGGGA